jgi:hypothetical protein
MARYLYSELAALTQARINCLDDSRNNIEWAEKHHAKAMSLVHELMPSGSGFDCGTIFDMDDSHANKLQFRVSFHHMDENGFYDGWTEHTIVATPSFQFGFDLRISGRNRNDIKEYIHEMFSHALRTEMDGKEKVA